MRKALEGMLNRRNAAVMAAIIVVVGSGWLVFSGAESGKNAQGPNDSRPLSGGAIDLHYRHADGTTSFYRLSGPEPTADGMGIVRTAYRLERYAIEPTATQIPYRVDWVDGAFRTVKVLNPCTWDPLHEDPCGASEITWPAGSPDDAAARSAAAAVNREGIFALQQEVLLTLPGYAASIMKRPDGATILEAETRNGKAWFVYGSSRYWPDHVEMRNGGESSRIVLERASEHEPAGGADVWPEREVASARDPKVLFPDADQDLLGSGTSVQEHYGALRQETSARAILDAGGCVTSVLHYVARDADPDPVKHLVTPQVTKTAFKITDRSGNRSEWEVTSTNGTLEDEGATAQGEGALDRQSPAACGAQKEAPWSALPTAKIHAWVAAFSGLPKAHVDVGYGFGEVVEHPSAGSWYEQVTFSFSEPGSDSAPRVQVVRAYTFVFEMDTRGSLLDVYIDRARTGPFLDGGFKLPIADGH